MMLLHEEKKPEPEFRHIEARAKHLWWRAPLRECCMLFKHLMGICSHCRISLFLSELEFPAMPHLYRICSVFSGKNEFDCSDPLCVRSEKTNSLRHRSQAGRHGEAGAEGGSELESLIRPDVDCCLRVSHRRGLKGGV